MYQYKDIENPNYDVLAEAIEKMLLILAPFVPHITEELWERIGKTGSIHEQRWPDYDEDALEVDEIEIVVQINGKVKGKLIVPVDASNEEILNTAKEDSKIKSLIEGKTIVKEIVVPGKLVNIVVK